MQEVHQTGIPRTVEQTYALHTSTGDTVKQTNTPKGTGFIMIF